MVEKIQKIQTLGVFEHVPKKIQTLGVFEDVPKKIQTQNHFQPRRFWLVSRGLRVFAEAVLEFDKGGRGKE